MGSYLAAVRENTPLVHNITNYVTVNDCANILLAAGASPIMADDRDDAPEITSICNVLNINIGTLNQRTIDTMAVCGQKSKELGHKVVLDPVGAGASTLRTNTALAILSQVHPDVVRGNVSEIKTLYFGEGSTSGVDAADIDKVGEKNLLEAVAFARDFAKKFGCVAAITGAIDIVSDADTSIIIRNGDAMMSTVTGTGCMLSALTAAYIAASDNTLEATASAVAAMGLSGELAKSRMSALDGNSSYRNYLIDAVYNLDAAALASGAKYETR